MRRLTAREMVHAGAAGDCGTEFQRRVFIATCMAGGGVIGWMATAGAPIGAAGGIAVGHIYCTALCC